MATPTQPTLLETLTEVAEHFDAIAALEGTTLPITLTIGPKAGERAARLREHARRLRDAMRGVYREHFEKRDEFSEAIVILLDHVNDGAINSTGEAVKESPGGPAKEKP